MIYYKIKFKKDAEHGVYVEHDGHKNCFVDKWRGKTFYATKSPCNNWFDFFEYNRRDRSFKASIQWLENIEELP
jgi:Holliday junction resolvase